MNDYLATLTVEQLSRLWDRAWARYTYGDGYQPFGYDWPTMRNVSPSWYVIFRAIQNEMNRRPSE